MSRMAEHLWDVLARDYGPVCQQLTKHFGAEFTVDSTGGGFYAICARLEGGHLVLITDGNDAGLNPLDETEGFGVGVYEEDGAGNSPRVYLRNTRPDPEALLYLVGWALRARAMQRC
jgi:hypothetical protein